MTRSRSPDGKKLGGTQRRVLEYLSDKMRAVSAIAAELGITTASAKCAVDRLFERGLVMRTGAAREHRYVASPGVSKMIH